MPVRAVASSLEDRDGADRACGATADLEWKADEAELTASHELVGIDIPASATHGPADSSKNACTALNNCSRFFSMMMLCVPSASST